MQFFLNKQQSKPTTTSSSSSNTENRENAKPPIPARMFSRRTLRRERNRAVVKTTGSDPQPQPQHAVNTKGSNCSVSTASADDSFLSSSSSKDESLFNTTSLVQSIPKHSKSSQRFCVEMNSQSWKVRPKRRRPPTTSSTGVSTVTEENRVSSPIITTSTNIHDSSMEEVKEKELLDCGFLNFLPYRDEMILQNAEGDMCGVVLQNKAPLGFGGRFQYTLYSLAPLHHSQEEPKIPGLYFCARITGYFEEEDQEDGTASHHYFSCQTFTNRTFTVDRARWSTFQKRAFCIKEKTVKAPTGVSNVARVTCLPETGTKELMVYPEVDPMIIVAFLAVMEEVLLVNNL